MDAFVRLYGTTAGDHSPHFALRISGNQIRTKPKAMPKYFFNTRIGDDLVRDTEGCDLQDADHAWEIARLTIRELFDNTDGAKHLLTARLEVTDVSGDIVLEFPFTEALFDTDASSETPPFKH